MRFSFLRFRISNFFFILLLPQIPRRRRRRLCSAIKCATLGQALAECMKKQRKMRRRIKKTEEEMKGQKTRRKANHLETFFYYHRLSCSASGYKADFIFGLTKYSIFRGIELSFGRQNSFCFYLDTFAITGSKRNLE